jgi:hypothetical protein
MSQYITKLETMDWFSWKLILGVLLNFANISPISIFVWTQTIAKSLPGRWGRRKACTHTRQQTTMELSKMRTLSSFMSQARFKFLYGSKTVCTSGLKIIFSRIGDCDNVARVLVPYSRGPGFVSWLGNGLMFLRFSHLSYLVSGEKFRMQLFLSTFFTITPCTLPLPFGTVSRIRF